jgi:Cdc6-like AAA superfamily ATPase
VKWTKKLRASVSGRKLRPDIASLSAADRSRADGPSAPSAFPRFQLSASDQITPRLSGRFPEVRRKLRAVFTPAQPVSDRRMFAGRIDILTSLIRAIEDQRLHVIIYGERGIGKTSLLHIMAQVAREARYIVVYSSCGAGSNFSDMFRAVAEEIPLLFHSGFAPTDTETEQGATLADLLPEGTITPRHVSELFAKLTATRLIVILDEFDRSESGEFRQSVAELIKNLSDRSVRAQLVIAGVAANLTELVEHIPSIRRNILGLQVPKMGAQEVRHLMQIGEDAAGVAFEDEAARSITSVAHGSPYVASLLSHHAGLTAIDAGRLAVTASDVSVAIDQALEEVGGRLSRLSQLQIEQMMSDGQGKLLGAVAGAALIGGGQFELKEVEAAVRDPAFAAHCLATVEDLAGRRKLLSETRDEFGRRFQFIEESVPVYLWMLLARNDSSPSFPGNPR